jgi:hypothetical protein
MQGTRVRNTEQSAYASEIDLVDIWLMVRRYLWLFLGVFVFATIIGLIISSELPIKYTYSVAVNVGAIRNDTTGKLEPVLSQDAQNNALQSSIIPAIQKAYVAKYPNAGLKKVEVGVSVSKDASSLTLSATGTGGQATAITALLDGIVAQMSQTQNALVSSEINADKQLLDRHISEIKSQLATTQKNYQQLVAHGNQTDKAFTFLLLDNQIAQYQRVLLTLEQQRDVSLATDMLLTRPVGSPQRSLNPTGVGRTILFGGVFIIALILGFLAVFIAHLRDAAELRRTRQN